MELSCFSVSDRDTALTDIRARLTEVAASWDTALTHANRAS
jgi:hypothetical protein